jgi:hypothetical protein
MASGQAVVDLLESSLWARNLNATNEEIVGALVAMVFEGIREYVIQVREGGGEGCTWEFGEHAGSFLLEPVGLPASG